jgi:capsular exopolysaccharide synthesis family protein
MLHRVFDQPNDWGLTGLLFGAQGNTDNGPMPTTIDNLSFIPSGPLPPNPSEVLGSNLFDEFVKRTQKEADIIIFDSPPLLTVTDAAILATKVDGTVLVVESGTTRRDAVRKSIESLEQVGARMLGVTLNRVGSRSDGYYYYSYYRSHYYSDENPPKKRRRRKDRLRRKKKEAQVPEQT